MADPIVNEIKEKLDIVDVISNYIPLKKSGANYKANCPFHGEKTPSFMVNRERQLYRCFGCGETGDIFSFVMKLENIDFPSALELLANKAGVTLPDKSSNQGKKSKINKTQLYAINRTTAKFWHQVLTTHPSGKSALDYLLKRGVTKESIDRFEIGFAPANPQPLAKVYSKHNYSSQELTDAGTPGRFRDRIMFPFADVIGNIIGFSGRATQPDQNPKYLNTSETALFHKNSYLYGLFFAKKAIAEHKKALLVEGQLDLVLAHQIGTTYAVATSGTALSDDHLRLLRRYTDSLHLALDSDDAGYKATLRALQLALPHGFDVSVVMLPQGSDPGEIIAKDPQKWHALASHPVSAIEWLFRYFFRDKSKKTSTERNQMYETLFPYIDLQTDPVSRTYSLQHLALLLGLTQPDAVIQAFDDWKQKQKPKGDTESRAPEPAQNAKIDNELTQKERSLLGLILLSPSLLSYKNFHLAPSDFTHPVLQQLYKLVIDWYNRSIDHSTSNDDKIKSSELISFLERQLTGASQHALQKLIFDTQTYVASFTPEQFLHEYTILIQAIRRRQREERIQSFSSQIAQAESGGDRAKVIDLVKQMQDSLKDSL